MIICIVTSFFYFFVIFVYFCWIYIIYIYINNIGFFIDQPDGSYDYFDIESGLIQITFDAENCCTLNIEGILGGDSVSMTYSGPINTYN